MSSEFVEPVGSPPGKGPITPGRVMLYTASVLFVIALAWFLVTIYSILILIVIGILFATAVEPIVNRLRRRNLSRSQAIMVVYGVLLGTLAIAFVLAAPTLIHHASNFDQTIPSFFDNLHQQALIAGVRFSARQARTLSTRHARLISTIARIPISTVRRRCASLLR